MENNGPIVYYLEGVEELRARFRKSGIFNDIPEVKSYYPSSLFQLLVFLNHTSEVDWPTHLIIGDELKPLTKDNIEQVGELINVKPGDFDYLPEGVVKLVREMARVKGQNAPEICLYTAGLYSPMEMKPGDVLPHPKYDEEAMAKQLDIFYANKNDFNSLNNILTWLSSGQQQAHPEAPAGKDER